MGRPLVLQKNYSLGMRQDGPRETMPTGTVWSMIDWIPNQAFPLQKRGGYEYHAASLGENLPFRAMTVAPFTDGAQLCVVCGFSDSEDRHVRLYADGVLETTLEQIGSWSGESVLTFHRDVLIGWSALGTTSFNGTTLTESTGVDPDPPFAFCASVYRDRTWAGKDNTHKTRVWWSDAGDPLTWDTSDPGGNWVDTQAEIQGLSSPGGTVLLVHHLNSTSLISGSPGVDLEVEGLFDIGLSDQRSLANWRIFTMWCDVRGVWITDGLSIIDLTRAGGMTDAYRASAKLYDHVIGSVFKDHYIVSMHDGESDGVTYVINLNTRTWFQFSNMGLAAACSYSGGFTDVAPLTLGYVDSERWFGGKVDGGDGIVDRVVRLDKMFTDESSEDADGTDILPVLETPFYEVPGGGIPGRELMRWTQLYLNYATSFGGVLSVTPSSDPYSSSALTAITDYVASTPVDRHPRRLGYLARGLRFRIEQTTASTSTHLYDLEAEIFGLEGNR